jgi:hypothetical protein
MTDDNQAIIDEFRGNGGRVSPVMYQAVGEDYAVFASKAGAR